MNIMSQHDGFLGLSQPIPTSYDQAKLVVIPFGLEASVSYVTGTRHGPNAMIQASHEVECFDETLWCEPCRYLPFVTLNELHINTPLESALQQLETLVHNILHQKKIPFIFGGEHSITAGAIRPFAKKYNNLTILHFDAHADLRDGYQGEHYSHASALRRCLDDPQVAQQGAHIHLVSCGIRNISSEELLF